MGLLSDIFYRKYRNLLGKLINKSKNDYYKSIFNKFQNNVKKSWNTVNNLIGKTSNKNSIKRLVVNGNIIDNNIDISSKFNDFFSSVANDLESKIPISLNQPSYFFPIPRQNSFFARRVSVNECSIIISKLKNTKYCLNSLPVKILKLCSDKLSPMITKLLNESLVSGVFPDFLKIATVIPIFKSGNREDVSCYRPISIVPLFSKIFESVMSTRIRDFICKSNIISPVQFGFLKGKSTFDAVSSFIEHVYDALNGKKHTVSVFLDLRKAFDTINHRILIAKLQNYGFRGVPLAWIESFLCNRKQRVKINNTFSEYCTLNIGLPQGTILAPLFFFALYK